METKQIITNRKNLYFTIFLVNLPFFGVGNCFGWSSPALPWMMSPEFFLEVTEIEASVVVSLMSFGGMFGPLLCSLLLDLVGRKYTIIIDMILMLVSWVLLFFAWRIEMIYLARFISGVTVAAVFSAVPLYIAEISEPKLRSVLSSLTLPTRNVSLVFVYAVAPFISYYHLTILSAVAPALFLILSPWMRESPYFLVSKGQRDKAKESMSWLRGGIAEDMCVKEIDIIQEYIDKIKAEQSSFKDLIKSEANRRSVLISVSLMSVHQLSGISVLLFYLESIFKATQSTIPSSLCATAAGTAMFIVALISPPILKKYGYIKPLTFSATGSGISLSLLGLYFFLIKNNVSGLTLNWLPVVSVVMYMFSFNLAFTNVPWAIMGEVFPQNIKAHAASLATAVCFLFSYLTTQFFPTLTHIFGTDYAFWFHGGFCFISAMYFYYFVPETKGLSLQEIQQLISKPLWGNKSPEVTTKNSNGSGLSMPMTDRADPRNPSGLVTITLDGKSSSNNIVSPKLSGTYTPKTC